MLTRPGSRLGSRSRGDTLTRPSSAGAWGVKGVPHKDYRRIVEEEGVPHKGYRDIEGYRAIECKEIAKDHLVRLPGRFREYRRTVGEEEVPHKGYRAIECTEIAKDHLVRHPGRFGRIVGEKDVPHKDKRAVECTRKYSTRIIGPSGARNREDHLVRAPSRRPTWARTSWTRSSRRPT